MPMLCRGYVPLDGEVLSQGKINIYLLEKESNQKLSLAISVITRAAAENLKDNLQKNLLREWL